jgi:hypothetical protein
MSEPKFTKGDWIMYTPDDDYGDLDYDEVVIGMDSFNEDCGRYYCHHVVKINGVEQDDDEGMANAYLIAAAPKMYSKLESIADGLRDAGGAGNNALAVEIEELLAEARGE